ncbi:MAG: hypothetical protein AB7O37_17260 [Vicinamibacteria bacterium]
MTLLSIAAAVVLVGASGLVLRTVWLIDRLAQPPVRPARAQPIEAPVVTIERRAA